MTPPHVVSQTLVYTINSVDASAYVQTDNAPQMESNLADSLDTFKITTYDPDQLWAPDIWDDFVVTSGSDTVFGGKITKITKFYVHQHVAYQVFAVDWGIVFARTTVNGVWQNNMWVVYDDTLLVQTIVGEVLPEYDVTTYVEAAHLPIPKVVFSRRSLRDVLNTICEYSGCSWYVDYDKKLHYFSSEAASAPFSLSDTPDDVTTFGFAHNSLSVDLDGDDIRNRVYVYGGMERQPWVTEIYDASGTTTVFPTAYKASTGVRAWLWQGAYYSYYPSGTLGGLPQDLGTTNWALYDYANGVMVFDVAPSAGTKGVMLDYAYDLPVTVRRTSSSSYTKFGNTWFDYTVYDQSITSKPAGVAKADAILAEYENERVLGKVRCFKPGLRAGQRLSVHSTALGLDGVYLIQAVHMTAYSLNYYEYEVEFGAWNPELVDYMRAFRHALTVDEAVFADEDLRDYLPLAGTLALAGTTTLAGTITLALWNSFRWGFAAWE